MVHLALGRRLLTSALTPLAAAIANNKSASHADTTATKLFLSSLSNNSNNASSCRSDVKNLFVDDMQAINYAIYRPSYPDELYERIFKYSKTGRLDAAADLATGSGQAAKTLAKSFTVVIGVDVSVTQLQNAGPESQSNIQYKEGSAEDTGLPSNSLDLVTVAQALHWFDLPSFYSEANRILKPDSTLAIWGYDTAVILCREGASAHENAVTAAANRLLLAIYKNEPLGPHWDSRRVLVDSHYSGIEPTSPLFRDIKRVDGAISIDKEVDLADIVGYVRTWSSYTAYMKKHKVEVGHPDRDPAEVFHRELYRVYHVDLQQAPTKVLLSWPLFLILATCNK